MKLHFFCFLLLGLIFVNTSVAQDTEQKDCFVVISGVLSDAISKKPLAEANVLLIEIEENDYLVFLDKGEINIPNSRLTCRFSFQTDENGYFNMKASCNKYYQLITMIDGFVTKVQVVSTAADNMIDFNFELENQEIFVDPTNSLLIKIEPIKFEINSLEVTSASKKELNKVILFLEKYPKQKIEIGVHGSSLGNDKFNLSLTQKRAASVLAYLKSYPWLDKERLTAVGYGETRLLNECSNGVRCRMEDHNKNKRVEFLIQNEYTPTSNLEYLKNELSKP